MINHKLKPKKILLGLQEGYCNLACPKCYTHGPKPISKNSRPSGYMKTEHLIKILDEVSEFKPRIAPQTWDEPFLNPNFYEHLFEIKKRNLAITMDTNGLLLNAENMHKMVELKVDSIFISLDAYHSETYKKVRGVDKLKQLEASIEDFLKIRDQNIFPRLGVSFVVEKDNANEVINFVDKWSKYVDVVRVNQQFAENRMLAVKPTRKRTACWSLDDSLMIHYNGEAALCCVDTHYENKIGNVITEGVLNVWNGHFFNAARNSHANLNFSNLNICEKCDLWSHDEPVVRKTHELLISETSSHTYYNRLDRLHNILENRLSI